MMCRFFEGMVKLGWTHQVPSTSKYHILIRVISIFHRWFFSAVCLTGPCCERRDSEQRGWQLSTERFLVLIWIGDKFCVERLAFAAAADNRRATDCEAL